MGVFLDEKLAKVTVQSNIDPSSNPDYYKLEEWETDTNKLTRRWWWTNPSYYDPVTRGFSGLGWRLEEEDINT